MRPGAVADAEEAGRGAGGVELVEDARGDFRVGAVVDGQGDFAALDGGGRQARQVGAEQCRPGQQAGGGQHQMVEAEGAERPRPAGGGGSRPRAAAPCTGDRKLDGGRRFPGLRHGVRRKSGRGQGNVPTTAATPAIRGRRGWRGGRRKPPGDLRHAGGEAVFAAVADEHRQAGRRLLQPAPHAEFRVGQLLGRRLPAVEAAGVGDRLAGQPAARIGRKQAEAVTLPGVSAAWQRASWPPSEMPPSQIFR